MQLYNQFNFETKEDVLYYILFTLEQLKINVEEVKLHLFGQLHQEHEIFKLCETYIKNVHYLKYNDRLNFTNSGSLNFTLQNTL